MMQDYLTAMRHRATLQSERKAEQDAETDEAKQRALETARAYVAGLQIEGVAWPPFIRQ